MSLIFFMLATLALVRGNAPKVHEEVDDIPPNLPARQVRDPFHPKPSSSFPAPVFNYRAALQQDHRQFRYAQQQEIDSRSILGQSTIQTTIAPNLNNSKAEVSPNRTPRRSIGKIRRADTNGIIYVDPEVIRERFRNRPGSEEDLQALNALLGQEPNLQLEGLRRILQNQPFPAKDHTPIVEEDEEEAVDLKNLKQGSLESIQAQLDEMAKEQTAKAIAKAQEDARAHVEAQHQTIFRKQAELQKAALARIALHNQNRQEEGQVHGYQAPVALPLVQAEAPHQIVEEPQYHQVIQQQTRPQQAYVHIVPKKGKISVTKTHSLTQERRHPVSGYKEEVVIETQHKLVPQLYHRKVQQEVPEYVNDEHLESEQYASRYAFGYKIKDAKEGNDFGHEEKRDGINAKGHYHVLLPDGRLQKVDYYADPTGYHAKVTYENLAHH